MLRKRKFFIIGFKRLVKVLQSERAAIAAHLDIVTFILCIAFMYQLINSMTDFPFNI